MGDDVNKWTWEDSATIARSVFGESAILPLNELHQYAQEIRNKVLAIKSGNQNLEKLRDFVSFYANCPYCQKSDVCADGCSFAEDDINAWDVMQQAREAMK